MFQVLSNHHMNRFQSAGQEKEIFVPVSPCRYQKEGDNVDFGNPAGISFGYEIQFG